MAWSAPLTAVDGVAFTASQYNQYIRDNMLEMGVAKATTATQYFTSTKTNELEPRLAKTATVATSQTTTSTSFTDLATKGPSVTVTTGKTAMVFIAAEMQNNTDNFQAAASFSASGASHVSAHESWKIISDGVPASQPSRYSMVRLVGKLTPGSTTFKMRYRVGGGTGTFANRTISVFPL